MTVTMTTTTMMMQTSKVYYDQFAVLFQMAQLIEDIRQCLYLDDHSMKGVMGDVCQSCKTSVSYLMCKAMDMVVELEKAREKQSHVQVNNWKKEKSEKEKNI